MQALKRGGLLSVVTYTGHAEGLQEHEAVAKLFLELPTDTWLTICLSLMNRKASPQLLCAWKRSQRAVKLPPAAFHMRARSCSNYCLVHVVQFSCCCPRLKGMFNCCGGQEHLAGSGFSASKATAAHVASRQSEFKELQN